jgi:predicted TPR repeat methyltransferase
MPAPRYRIRFPISDLRKLGQDEAYFLIQEGPETRKIRLHDYGDIYAHKGLYEQLFYDRLKCTSPRKVASLLSAVVSAAGENVSELRMLDIGAGNGMMGEALLEKGAARMVGVDIIPESKMALERDRPGMYDDYYVVDLTHLTPDQLEDLQDWGFTCMTTVAALGFGDIPVAAFGQAFNLISDHGWIAFNIKETFLSADGGPFARFIKRLILEGYLDLHHLERYRHRLSVEGMPLHYFAIVGRKNRSIPAELLSEDVPGD